MSLAVTAFEHHARRLVAAVGRALIEKASGFSTYEAGDYLESRSGAWGDGHGLADDCTLMTSAAPPAAVDDPGASSPLAPGSPLRATAKEISDAITVDLWGKKAGAVGPDARVIGNYAAAAVLAQFNVTPK